MREEVRGFKALIQDAVHHGSLAIERIQKETAEKPFTILESVPLIEAPARAIHEVHDSVVSGVHQVIREVNQIAGAALDQILETPKSD